MKCNVCGSELKENERFCGNCGASRDNMEETPEVPVENASKKKVKLPKALIAVAAAIVLLVGGFFIFKDAIMGRIAFMLPAESQLKLAYKQAAKDWAKESGEFVTDVNEMKVSEEGTVSGDVSVSIGDAAKKELEEEAGLDLGDISKVFVAYEARYNDSKILYDMSVGLGKTKIMTMDIVMDMEEEVMSLTIPELNDTAIEFEMESDLNIDMEEFEYAMEQPAEMQKLMEDILPSEKLLEDMIPRYIAVMVQAIDEVERQKDVVEVGDVSQKATALTVELDDDLIENIGTVFVKELEEDKALEEYLKGAAKALAKYQDDSISNSEWKDIYDDFLEGMEDAFDSMAEEEMFKKGIEIVTWVNSKNEIIGFEIEDTIEIMSVKDGKKVAKQIQIMEPEYDEKLLKILAEGEEKKEVFTGDVKLYVSGEKVFTTQVDRFKWTDDQFDLVASFDVTEEMLEALDLGDLYSDITLKVEISTSKKATNIAFKGIINDKEWVVLECSGKEKEGKTKISYPSDTVSADDIDEWVETMDAETIVKNLEKVGVLDILDVDKDDLIDSIEAYADYYLSNDYYEDDYYDDYDDYYYDEDYDYYY